MTAEVHPKILLIEDEPHIRRFLGISLRMQGYQVLEAASGREAREIMKAQSVDLVVLDLGLPDIEGRDLLIDLRASSTVPVMVLSVRSSENEKVALLDAGANDYMTKPFGVQELSARVRALLRQRPGPDVTAVFDDGRLRIDLGLRQVWLMAQLVSLSRKEWALLSVLLQHAGRVVTQPHLLRELWGPTHTQDTHYLRILTAKLRGKLGDDAADPAYIGTEPGVGLRFLG